MVFALPVTLQCFESVFRSHAVPLGNQIMHRALCLLTQIQLASSIQKGPNRVFQSIKRSLSCQWTMRERVFHEVHGNGAHAPIPFSGVHRLHVF